MNLPGLADLQTSQIVHLEGSQL